MTFWMLLGQFSTLFLSLQFTTGLEFDRPIESYIFGGSKNQIYSSLSPDSRVLIIKPLDTDIDTNLTIFTKEGAFNFWIKLDPKESPHVYVRVKRGKKDFSYKVLKENSHYRILEGNRSILFENRSKTNFDINGHKVQSKGYFSKGAPVFINEERVLW